MEEMQKLLTKLQFSQTYFDEGKLLQIKCNKEKTSFEFFIEVKTITYKKYIEFIKRLKSYYPAYTIKVKINILNKNIENTFFELYNEYLKQITLNQYKEYKVKIENNKINIECANDYEKYTLTNIIKEIKEKLQILGYTIEPNVTINEELNKQIEEQIKKDLQIDYTNYNEPVEYKEERLKYPKREPRDKTLVVDNEEGVIKGRIIEGIVTKLSEIKETDRAVIEVKIFSTDVITTKKDLKIITLKMTDFTDSIYGKIFIYADDDLNNLLKNINNKTWYKISGQVKYDEYAKELSMIIKDINKSDKKDEIKTDDAKEKRVELHAHTMMSQMDGVIDEIELVKAAMKYGHRAIAITDHDSCQAFPHVYSEICKFNSNLESPIKAQIKELEALEEKNDNILKQIEDLKKQKEKLPYFKGLYGVELEMTDDDLNIIYNSKDVNTDDLTYVVFDTETTGFNPGLHDQMIEIGAVKMYKGEVIERFDELINPNRKLDAVITNLTGITDSKLENADSEENVTKRFKEWIGDLPLVAHNATFDKNMLDMAYYKYNLGKLENPVIDTLMLSRIINKDLKRHSLTALSKHYGMNFAEEDDEENEENNNLGTSVVTNITDVLINNTSIYNKEKQELNVYSTEEETLLNIKVLFKDNTQKEVELEIKPGINTINVENKTNNVTIIINKIRSHHRADYDAENTGYIFVKMLDQIKGLKNLNDFLNPGYIESLAGIKPVKYMTDYDNIPKQTRSEELTNINQKTKHITLIAKTREGLKNIFKLISYANTGFIAKSSRIPRRIVEQNRKDVLIGSACLNGEIFDTCLTKNEEELKKTMEFYDYIEVQPPSNYMHLVKSHDLSNYNELIYALNKIIKCSKEENKIICATSDAHTLNKEDKIYREIIVNQNVPGKGRHALAKYLKKDNIGQNKNLEIIKEIIENSKKIYGYELDLVTKTTLKLIATLNNIEEIASDFDTIYDMFMVSKEELIKLGKDFEKNKREMLHDAIRTLLSQKAIIDIKGEYKINNQLKTEKQEEPHISDQFFRTTNEMLEEFNFLDEKTKKEIVIENPNKIVDLVEKDIEVIIATEKPFSPIIEDSEKTTREMVYNKAYSIYGNPLPENIEKRIEDELRGIIGGGFDVIYLIAQKLVKHSNDDGYIVGSRGSVGSSFVATMMGITEVNSLPAHYVCPKCKHSIFEIDGKVLGADYSSGFDLPDMNCPNCKAPMNKEGNDMPFATFLGFNADKVPDIDLNFSGDNQASAHEYTKVLFGTDNVYRAGTIGTVADKTAFGFVQGFYEDKIYDSLRIEANSYNIKVPSKDELKKKKIIKCQKRVPEVERIALGCTGVKRTTGQHPGGIVVVPGYKEVFDFTPFQYPADDPTVPWRTTHFDYHAIDQDLLKLDILGHDDPTVLRLLQDLSKEEVKKNENGLETFVPVENLPRDENGIIDVTKVPLGDKDTMKIFSSPDVLGVTKDEIMCETGTLGIPEFGTKFVIQMLVDTKPKTFAELIKISGLSHGTDVWLGNAQDLIKNNIVPFKEVIGCRDDIMVYLRYHGMKDLDAFKIMEFVRKGKASKEPDKWAEFRNKMKEAGIEEWFIDSCNKIKYMFPKAHATAYVTSAFRIAWYKVHYPILYYCAYMSIRCADFDVSAMVNGYNAIKNKLIDITEKGSSASNKETNVYDVMQIALEASARGIKFAQIDIEKSDAKYFKILDKNTLLLPFRCLDGLGDSVAQKIVYERQKNPFYSIEDLQKRGGVSKTLIEKMKELGILDNMDESNQLSLF